jgi:hypothetical protein
MALKQLTKTESLLFPQSSSKTGYTADAEIFNIRRLLLAQKPLRKTSTQGPKNHPRSLVLRLTLSSSARKDYNWLRNSRQKLSPCCSQSHPRKPVLRLTMKSSMYVDYCFPWKRWGKLGPRDPKIIQEAQFYGWRCHLQRRKTTTGSEIVDRNWVPAVPKVILENQFFGWRWNLQCT